MHIRQSNVISILLASIFAFSGIIEIIHPAPKVSDFCTQVSCQASAKDTLVGASEDYFGGLFPWLSGGFILSILGVVIFLVFTKNKNFILIGSVFLLDIIIYTVISRFYHFFSRWPTQSWVVIILGVAISMIILRLSSKQRTLSGENGV